MLVTIALGSTFLYCQAHEYAEAYQHLLDIAARADFHEGIRQGIEEARQGKSRDIEEFFADFEAKHGLPG